MSTCRPTRAGRRRQARGGGRDASLTIRSLRGRRSTGWRAIVGRLGSATSPPRSGRGWATRRRSRCSPRQTRRRSDAARARRRRVAARAQAFVTRAGRGAGRGYDGVRILALRVGHRAGVRQPLPGGRLRRRQCAPRSTPRRAARGRSRPMPSTQRAVRRRAGRPRARRLPARPPGCAALLEPSRRASPARSGCCSTGRRSRARRSRCRRPRAAPTCRSTARWRRDAGARRPRRPFTPTLQSVLPSGLDADARRRRPRPRGAAAAARRARPPASPATSRRCWLGSGTALTAEGVNVHAIDSMFDGETAVALSPGPTPSLLIVARTANQAATQSELAGLEGPLTALFPAPSGGAGADPGAGRPAGRRRHRPRARPRRRAPARLRGVQRARGRVDQRSRDRRGREPRPLARRRHGYRTALADRPEQLSSLLFTDFSQLLGLGEQTD